MTNSNGMRKGYFMNDFQPLISIVMPVYNNEKYVQFAVNSVMTQKFRDYELILVDDGSTDSTPQILDELEMKYDSIRVIHQSNQWIYASFNNGIKAARGEYVYILNSDDKLCERILETLANKVEEYHYPDVVWTPVICYRCDSEQNIIEEDVNHWSQLIKKEEYLADAKQVRRRWPFLVESRLAQNQANLYKRKLMIKHPFRNDIYGADTLFNIQIASDVETSVIMKAPVYEYYIYDMDAMNASIGKYYGYEHSMFNDFFVKYKRLFQGWNLSVDSYWDIIREKRLRELTVEIKSLSSKQCTMSVNDKLKMILNEYVDEILLECGSGKYREEMESRILSGIQNILRLQPIDVNAEMYFIYQLLESLLRYEKDEADFDKICSAVNHPLNPYHIGESFYNRLYKQWEDGI